MRISSNLFFQTGLNSINAQQSDLVHLYKQVGSGKRMVTPSDDPLAAAQAINISQTLAMGERYAANRNVAMRSLGMEENVLNTVTIQLQDVKTRLVEAGNGTMSSVDRNALADVLALARENLLNLANSTDGNGQYIFSGSLGNTAPFTAEGAYQGDNRQRLIQVDQTRQLPSSDIGVDVFSRAAPGNVGYVFVPGRDSITGEASNTGTASIVSYSITNATGVAAGRKVAVEFVPSDLLDPADTIRYEVTVALDGGEKLTYQQTATVPADGQKVSLLDAGLGFTVEMTGVPALGDRFEIVPMHSPQYSLSGDLADKVYSVSGYKGAETFVLTYDAVANKFTGPDGSVATVTHDPDTSRYTVEVGGVVIELRELPAADATLTVKPGVGSQVYEDLNMFKALDDVIKALQNPGATEADNVNLQNALNSALQRIDVIYNNVLSVRASAGTRMNEVEALNSNGATRILDYKKQLSDLEDLDYYSAITQLTLRSTALEAAAMAFQKIQNTSLFNLNARG